MRNRVGWLLPAADDPKRRVLVRRVRGLAHLLRVKIIAPIALCLVFALVLLMRDPSPVLREAEAGKPVLVLENTHGVSMEPLFRTGERVHYQAVPFASVQAGDVLVFWRGHPSCIVVHMALERSPWGWRTVGVNNDRADADFVTHENYMGVAVHKPP